MRFKTLTAVTTAAALLAVGGSTATAAPSTGSWSGELSQDLALLDEPYTTKFGIQALHGRIALVNVEVRMACGEYAIRDAQVFKHWRSGRGPQLNNGGFTFRAHANWGNKDVGVIRVSGQLGRRNATGTATASGDGCRGEGDWTAKRRF